MSTKSRAAIVAADKAYVWHPYTPMDKYVAEIDPLVIDRAEGARLFDRDGRSYLDANASWWVASLGHRHPRLVEALKRQADTLVHCSLAGTTHENAALLAEELVAIAPPGLTRVFYSDDGSTAIEVALKLAVQYFAQTGRPEKCRFVTLDSAFHGETVGASSVGGVTLFRQSFRSILFPTALAPSPAGELGEEAAIAALEALFASEGATLAGIVIEPLVQGAAGMKMYGPAYLRAVRALCDRHDVLFIDDEVFTGYGRTGTFWACEQASAAPDVVCTAKGFSGGMLPMAATLVSERIYDGFRGDASRAFYYGHSFCGNPLGAAIAREVLAIYRDENVLGGIPERHARIRQAFDALGERVGTKNARALGMIGAIDLSLRGEPRARVGHDADVDLYVEKEGYLADSGWAVYERARAAGAYLRPLGNVIYVAPPLNIPLADLDELLAIVTDSVTAVLG
jgi:adenosylmethionine-8-amino-7-oxononanoate aminotransferase